IVMRDQWTSVDCRFERLAGHGQIGHGSPEEQPPAGNADPSRPLRRSLDARAVGRDARVRVHVSVELRDEYEGDPGTNGFDDARSRPDVAPPVKAIPRALGAHSNLLERHRRVERVLRVTVEPEDERAEDVDAMTAKLAQPRHELVAGQVEAFVDILEPFAGHRLDADERAANLRALHRVEEFRVFGGLHRNLGVEDEIVRQLGEPRHQREALVAQRLELAQPRGIGSAPRLRQIVERDRLDVVVGERDESKSETAQLDDLADDAIDAALARLLSVGPPHGTERAMLRAAAQRLYRRPHVPPLRKQIPSRRHELIASDAAPFVDRPRLSSQALLDDARPDDVAVAAHDRVRLTVSRGFVRKQRGMNAAEDDPGAALAHLASDLVTAERVAGMNADADDVARANRVEIDRIERFVDDDRIAPAAAGRRREDV